jgi:hypothetical protein
MGIETAENVPAWIQQLVRDIGEQLHPLGFMGQLGFRYLPPDAQANITQRWVIGIYPVPYELSGGKRDGVVVVAGFCLDLLKTMSQFSDITTLEWRVPRRYTDGLSGPEFWLEGRYQNKELVQLHVYADCPADELPTLVLDVVTGTLRVK